VYFLCASQVLKPNFFLPATLFLSDTQIYIIYDLLYSRKGEVSATRSSPRFVTFCTLLHACSFYVTFPSRIQFCHTTYMSTFRRNISPQSSVATACHLLARCFAEPISSTLKMGAICSFETSAETQRTTRRNIPEDDSLQMFIYFTVHHKPKWFENQLCNINSF
jgi:hypothetical protein